MCWDWFEEIGFNLVWKFVVVIVYIVCFIIEIKKLLVCVDVGVRVMLLWLDIYLVFGFLDNRVCYVFKVEIDENLGLLFRNLLI